MKSYENENSYLEAKRQVHKIKSFYISLLSYTVFIIFLAGLNYYVNKMRNPWFLWAAFGWGIGLFFQGMKTFQWFSIFGKEWEEKRIQKYMEDERKRNGNF